MDDRIEAAISWLITGSWEAASKLCGIPASTIRQWSTSSWWEDVLTEAKTKKQAELDAVWTGLIHDATKELRDRVENGEVHLTRTGEKRRIPLKARDLATVVAMAVEKRALARGQATSRTEKITLDQRLDKLGKKFDEEGKIIEEEEVING